MKLVPLSPAIHHRLKTIIDTKGVNWSKVARADEEIMAEVEARTSAFPHILPKEKLYAENVRNDK